MIHGIRMSHYLSRFAAFVIDTRAKISTVGSLSITKKKVKLFNFTHRLFFVEIKSTPYSIFLLIEFTVNKDKRIENKTIL
mmetsp:Transcript_16992/g.33392  ORF Transcript_16992/g.33392 Transcript_16992/m.33392 type:complete len:80 (+) Transcript_16992:151-390(+)